MSNEFLETLAAHEIVEMREFALGKALESLELGAKPISQEVLLERAKACFRFLCRGRKTD